MRRATAQSAFTLIELLLAAAVIALVLGSAVLVFQGVTAGQARAESQAQLQQHARVAANAIVAAIRNAYRPTDPQDTELEGIDDVVDGQPADRLRLFAIDPGQVRPDQPESDVHEVAFFLAAAEDQTQPSLNLMRRTDPTRNREPDQGGVVERVASHVLGLDFEYLNQDATWTSQWEASREQWPRAVRFRLVLVAEGPNGPEQWTINRLVNFVRYPAAGDSTQQASDSEQGSDTQPNGMSIPRGRP